MAIYYNGKVINPVLTVPHDIYDDVIQTTENIQLNETTTVYLVKPTSAIALTFDTTNLRYVNEKYVTFILAIDMTDGLQNITWPSTVVWNNTTPIITTNTKYTFRFMKPAGENIWIGDQIIPNESVQSSDIKHVVKLTQVEYDALSTKDPKTFYVIYTPSN